MTPPIHVRVHVRRWRNVVVPLHTRARPREAVRSFADARDVATRAATLAALPESLGRPAPSPATFIIIAEVATAIACVVREEGGSEGKGRWCACVWWTSSGLACVKMGMRPFLFTEAICHLTKSTLAYEK
jgi:hypothetical protein